MRLPAVKAARSFSVTKTRGASGSWRTQLTTMSLSASRSATGTFPSGVSAQIRSGASGSGAIWMIWVEWIGDADGRDVPVGQDPHIVNTVCVQRGDGAAGGRAEPDDRSAQPAAVAAGDPGGLHRVQDGAVACQLVVLVKDVQPEPAVGLPVIHRLERDQRQPPIDGDLGQGGVLHAVRPAPDDLSRPHLGQDLRPEPSVAR